MLRVSDNNIVHIRKNTKIIVHKRVLANNPFCMMFSINTVQNTLKTTSSTKRDGYKG